MRAVTVRGLVALICLLLLQAQTMLGPRLNALIQKNVSTSTNAYKQFAQQALPAQLWIQVRSPAQTQLVNSHLAWFKALRWQGRPIDIRPLQVVPDGPAVSQLRFFKAEDKTAADALRAQLAQKIPSLELKDLSGVYRQVTWLHPGHLELYLAPTLTRFSNDGH